MGSGLAHYANPDLVPGPDAEITFDPLEGFSDRPVREMVATPEEMESAKLDLQDRDYCAHHLLDYRACRADTFPFVYKCAHEKHVYLTCEYQDYVMRMKEYERERRLLELEHKKKFS